MLCKVKGSRNYHVRFTAPNGKRVRESTGTSNKRLAQEFEQRLKEKYYRAERLGEVVRTWEQAVTEWAKGKNHERLRMHLNILDPYCKGKDMTELSQVSERVKSDRSGVSNATINRTLEVLKSVLISEYKKGLIYKVPHIQMLPEPKGSIRWITKEEAQRLLDELPDHLSRMARFSLATGLRDSNVSGLEWRRVDLERRLVWVEADSHKNGEAHQVPLSKEAVLVLREAHGENDRWVFTYKGDRVDRINNHAWRNAVKRAGIDPFRVHDMRHTWASWHAMKGTPLPVIQKLGGWKSLSMVMRYAHLCPSHVSGWADNASPFEIITVKELAKSWEGQ